ncbi:MAG: Gmad2 immunoglobulin-like domain-containing protein [Actinomycetes bacterium]
MNPHDEQRLRDLLDGAVSDVEPRHGLEAITSRTKVSSMSTRPWLYGVAGAVVATAATIAAFAVLGDDTAPTSGPEPVDSPSASQTRSATESPTSDASPTDEQPELRTVPAYYVGETSRGPRLYREFHQVRTEMDPATAAVHEAVAVDPLDPDYGSPWFGTGAGAGSVTHDGGTITVDLVSDQQLRSRPAGMSKAEASMAVEQVLYTVQAALQSRDPVQLLLNGGRTDQLLGVPVAEPLAQGDEMATLAQVWIIEPQHGDTVRGGAEVSGIGAFFEANVTWELRQEDQVVESGFTTAEQCCTMAPYSFDLPDVPAGDYELVVSDSDASGGEGPAPFSDTKRITIR